MTIQIYSTLIKCIYFMAETITTTIYSNGIAALFFPSLIRNPVFLGTGFRISPAGLFVSLFGYRLEEIS